MRTVLCIVLVVSAAAAGALEPEYPASDILRFESGDAPGEAWRERFRAELADRLRDGRVSAAAVRLVKESAVSWENLPGDPAAAAERVYEHVRIADRGLKTGTGPAELRLRIRQRLEARGPSSGVPENPGKEHAEEIRRQVANSVPPGRENQFIHRKDDVSQVPANPNNPGGGR